MKMARAEAPALRQRRRNRAGAISSWIARRSACYTHLARGTSFGGRLADLAGKSVLLATGSQLTSGTCADRARRCRAPHHHSAARRCARAFRGAVRRRRNRRRRRSTMQLGERILDLPLRVPVSLYHQCRLNNCRPRHFDRMGDADVGHDRRAENGRAYACRPDRAVRAAKPRDPRRGLGDVL